MGSGLKQWVWCSVHYSNIDRVFSLKSWTVNLVGTLKQGFTHPLSTMTWPHKRKYIKILRQYNVIAQSKCSTSTYRVPTHSKPQILQSIDMKYNDTYICIMLLQKKMAWKHISWIGDVQHSSEFKHFQEGEEASDLRKQIIPSLKKKQNKSIDWMPSKFVCEQWEREHVLEEKSCFWVFLKT